MFLGRRRPLMRAAMLGGAGYMVGKRRAQAQEAEAEQEQGQDARISALEQQQQAPPPPGVTATGAPPQAAATPQPVSGAAPQADLVGRLKELSDMRDSGALSPEEFQQAKAQLLGNG